MKLLCVFCVTSFFLCVLYFFFNDTATTEIYTLSLHDALPISKVAPDYEKVVAAIYIREQDILAAKAEAIRTNALAGAQAFNIRTQAESDRISREVEAQARAALFTNQIPVYLASP